MKKGRPFSAEIRRLGEVGEEQEESEGGLGMCLGGVGVACGGPATEQWWRRPSGPVAAALR